MKIRIALLIMGVLIGSNACTKLEDLDCSGRDDYSTTSFIDSAKAANISSSICNCLNTEGIPGIQISIIDSLGEEWTLSTGTVDKKRNTSLKDYHQFRLASVTKTFIAALIFKLEEEGKLSLEDKVSQYFPKYVNASKITIAQLLNHSSGVKDLLRLPDILLTSASNTSKVWNPNTIAETVLKKDLLFTPGTDNQYSNSNYLLLGLIAKQVSGKELDELLGEELFLPENVSGITFNPIQKAPNELISGYDRKFIPLPGTYELTKESTSFSSAAYASGNLVANSSNAAQFFYKLFNGQIISQESLNKMQQFTTAQNPDSEYLSRFGLGLFEYNLNNETYYGHEGQFIGFDNIVIYQPRTKVTVVLLANISTYKKFDLLKDILIYL